jgi:hypothetical protein
MIGSGCRIDVQPFIYSVLLSRNYTVSIDMYLLFYALHNK